MKALLLSAATLLSFNSAHADIINCYFTEPFVTTSYSMTQSTLTITENIENKTEVIKNVSFQIKGAGLFELVGKDGKVLQTLKLNNNGSDGMSDTVYPYEGRDNSWNVVGGCESNHQKAIIVE